MGINYGLLRNLTAREMISALAGARRVHVWSGRRVSPDLLPYWRPQSDSDFPWRWQHVQTQDAEEHD